MLTYGTAGYRGKLVDVKELVDPVSLYLLVMSVCDEGRGYGIQFTASHNMSQDHGMKICTPDGVILGSNEELLLEEVVHLYYTGEREDLCNWAQKRLVGEYRNCKPHVVFGVDIRPGSDELWDALCMHLHEWALRMQIREPEIYACGEVTTPMLHWMTAKLAREEYPDDRLEDDSCESMCEADYVQETMDLWNHFLNYVSCEVPRGRIIDYAHGVGQRMDTLLKASLAESNSELLSVNNTKDNFWLNRECGADDLHKTMYSPKGLPFGQWDCMCVYPWKVNGITKENMVGISFDGDADRILYWRPRAYMDDISRPIWDERYVVDIMDGDRITTLWVEAFMKLMNEIEEIKPTDYTFEIIHTAYSNDASIRYWSSKGWRHQYASTGVKNLHPKAEEVDVGVYFEPNGHGTIVVRDEFLQLLHQHRHIPAAAMLRSWLLLANHLVGDAVRNVFLTEGALYILNYTVDDWFKMYQEDHSINQKLYGYDKSVLKVEKEDRVVSEPVGLQAEIDALIEENGGKVIIRSSGTEDLIRLYIEHPFETKLNLLKDEMMKLINHYIPSHTK